VIVNGFFGKIHADRKAPRLRGAAILRFKRTD
jgi:hypothetical protein